MKPTLKDPFLPKCAFHQIFGKIFEIKVMQNYSLDDGISKPSIKDIVEHLGLWGTEQ